MGGSFPGQQIGTTPSSLLPPIQQKMGSTFRRRPKLTQRGCIGPCSLCCHLTPDMKEEVFPSHRGLRTVVRKAWLFGSRSMQQLLALSIPVDQDTDRAKLGPGYKPGHQSHHPCPKDPHPRVRLHLPKSATSWGPSVLTHDPVGAISR